MRTSFVAPRSLIEQMHAIARSKDLSFAQEMRRLAREYVEQFEAEAEQEREAA